MKDGCSQMTRENWRALYQAARRETNPEELKRKADFAIAAIHQRIDELPRNDGNGRENDEIFEALQSLQKMLLGKDKVQVLDGQARQSGAA